MRRGTAAVGRFSPENVAAVKPHVFDAEPFVEAYRRWSGRAVQQLRSGERKFHWAVKLFPSPPHVYDQQLVSNLGVDKYCLCDPPPHPPERGVVAARAFLAHADGVRLRDGYVALCRELCAVIDTPVPPVGPVGVTECFKMLSSFHTFAEATADGRDPELYALCTRLKTDLPPAWPLPAAALENWDPASRLRRVDRRLPYGDIHRVEPVGRDSRLPSR